jgi:hypothetical protein
MKKILGLLAGTVLCTVAVSGFAQVAAAAATAHASCVRVTLKSANDGIYGTTFDVALPNNPASCSGDGKNYGLVGGARKTVRLSPQSVITVKSANPAYQSTPYTFTLPTKASEDPYGKITCKISNNVFNCTGEFGSIE